MQFVIKYRHAWKIPLKTSHRQIKKKSYLFYSLTHKYKQYQNSHTHNAPTHKHSCTFVYVYVRIVVQIVVLTMINSTVQLTVLLWLHISMTICFIFVVVTSIVIVGGIICLVIKLIFMINLTKYEVYVCMCIEPLT